MTNMTRTNHGALVPLPSTSPWAVDRDVVCPRCRTAGRCQFYEINSDYGDERWRCARSLGGCGFTRVAEGPDA